MAAPGPPAKLNKLNFATPNTLKKLVLSPQNRAKVLAKLPALQETNSSLAAAVAADPKLFHGKTVSPAEAKQVERTQIPIGFCDFPERKEPVAEAKKGSSSEPFKHLETLLRSVFPQAFRGPPRPPLAIGIFNAILEVEAGDIDRHELARFMRWWTSRWDYRDALAHAEMRVNLDGSPAGVPTEAEQEHAARQVYGAQADKILARIKARLNKASI